MYNQIGPFKKLTDGPARTHKMAMILSYPLGVYHFVVYANSGIKSLADIKGKTGLPRPARAAWPPATPNC